MSSVAIDTVPRFADEETHKVGGLSAQRHEVDQRGLAVGSDKTRFPKSAY